MDTLDPIDPRHYRDLVTLAIAEDLGAGDVTTSAVAPAGARASAVLLAKTELIVAGLDVAGEVFRQTDPSILMRTLVRDGLRATSGEILATLDGPAAGLLAAERTALNFLQYLSGIATATRRFVDAAGGRIVVLDTRKTTPGYRWLAKYAVRCGGGTNHRAGLYDGVLIKDNHIRLAGGVREAVTRVRAAGWTGPIEVEAENPGEVDAALDAAADVIMLDNFDDEMTEAAVARIGGRARVELSGTMTEARVRRLALVGADFVSVGAITHSAPAADISLEITIESGS